MSHHATRTLRELGYRLTPQRTLVWDALREAGGHLGAEEICALVQSRFPNVNISTVYRTLELLVELQLVRETLLGPDRRYYEIEEDEPHHHLVCDRCGAVQHVHDEDLGGLRAALEQRQGFRVRELTTFGLCAACNGQAEPNAGGGHAHS
ncbi:MAG: transcriptional repressor [Thermoleophilia bacterium]|nr:transcriptional repressor [Thermoleophilia bacterium]